MTPGKRYVLVTRAGVDIYTLAEAKRQAGLHLRAGGPTPLYIAEIIGKAEPVIPAVTITPWPVQA